MGNACEPSVRETLAWNNPNLNSSSNSDCIQEKRRSSSPTVTPQTFFGFEENEKKLLTETSPLGYTTTIEEDVTSLRWRKYGRKLVKGSTQPKHYFKCTFPDCPMKKQVELTEPNGTIEQTEIVTYIGKHSHPPPKIVKAFVEKQEQFVEVVIKESLECNRRENPELVETDRLLVELGENVDFHIDGFQWRKYGQKTVEERCIPRSYYRCTNCKVKKQVNQSTSSRVTVVYEGTHDHPPLSKPFKKQKKRRRQQQQRRKRKQNETPIVEISYLFEKKTKKGEAEEKEIIKVKGEEETSPNIPSFSTTIRNLSAPIPAPIIPPYDDQRLLFVPEEKKDIFYYMNDFYSPISGTKFEGLPAFSIPPPSRSWQSNKNYYDRQYQDSISPAFARRDSSEEVPDLPTQPGFSSPLLSHVMLNPVQSSSELILSSTSPQLEDPWGTWTEATISL